MTTRMTVTKTRSGRRQVHVRREDPARGKAGAGSDGRVAPEGIAYREDYLPDRGPDLDEALDGTESGHEP